MKWLWMCALAVGCGYHEYAIPSASDGNAMTSDESTGEVGELDADVVNAACRSFCDMLLRCDPGPPYPNLESCERSCEQNILGTTPYDCGAAQLGLHECLAVLECDDYFAFVNATPAGAFPCADEASPIVPLCS